MNALNHVFIPVQIPRRKCGYLRGCEFGRGSKAIYRHESRHFVVWIDSPFEGDHYNTIIEIRSNFLAVL